MPQITIIGVKDNTYIDKHNKEVQQCEVFYTKRDRSVDGLSVGSDMISSRNFPDEVEYLLKLRAEASGLIAYISKDVKTYGDKSYTYVDEFIIDDERS